MFILHPGTRLRQMAVRGGALAAVTADYGAALTSGGASGWSWFTQAEAIYDAANDRYLFGGVAGTGSDSGTGTTRLHYFDHDADDPYAGRLHAVTLYAGIDRDDHCNAAVLKLDAGGPLPGCYVYGFAGHNSAVGCLARVGQVAGSPSALSGNKTANASLPAYSVLMQAQDTARTLYYWHREPQGATWGRVFHTSTDGGMTWGAAVKAFTNAGQRPYPQFCMSDDGLRVDVVLTTAHPTAVSGSLWHWYYTIAADGSRNWYKGDGTLASTGDASLPLTVTNGLQVYDGSTTNSWLWDLCNVEGVLTLAYTHRGTGGTLTDWAKTHYYRIARFVAGSWVSEDVCDGGGTGADYLYAAESAYSGGICLDPLDRDKVYVSRKYGAGDFRVEEWRRDTGSGVWSKFATRSPTTGVVHARPRRVRDTSPTMIEWMGGTYTTFTNYSTDIYTYPPLTQNAAPAVRTKPASPAWQAGSAPSGCINYWPFTDGSGTTVTDYEPTSASNGTFTGLPVWGTGTYGAELGGFAAAKYVKLYADGVQALTFSTWPFWVAALVKVTSVGVGVPLGVVDATGSAGCALFVNRGGVSGRVTFYMRDNAGTGGPINLDANSTSINDGGWHVLMGVSYSSTLHALYLDGVEVGLSTANAALTAVTTSRTSVGVLFQGSNPFTTGSVAAAAMGQGGCPDPKAFAEDWLYGTFAAVRP